MQAYLDFLREKIRLAPHKGFNVDRDELNPALKPHTRDIVAWALRGGQRAIFASFGLHKTATQLEIHRQIGLNRPEMFRLQVAPLGVRLEFQREIAQRFTGDCAMDLRFIRRDSEIDDPATLYLTNYEAVREGNVTPALFGATSLDEASVLRSYGSKTYQEFLPAFESVEFKFVATATPSPNRFKELIHYAGYLGVMDTGQALTRFFQRDSEKANNLTLYPHKEQEFWLWVASWAAFIQRPSDLGHDDTGYVLPDLDVRYHEVPSDYEAAGTEKDGQGLLIPNVAMGLSSAAAEKRDSLDRRVATLMEIVDAHFREAQGLHEGLSGIKQGGASEEAAGTQRRALQSQQGFIQGEVQGVAGGEPGAVPRGHEAACRSKPAEDDGAQPPVVQGQSGPRQANSSEEQVGGIRPDNGSVRRDAAGSEGGMSDLPGANVQACGGSLPRKRKSARSSMPKVQLGAGASEGVPGDDSTCGRVPDQIIIWCDLNAEQDAIEKALASRGLSFSSVHGALTTDEVEQQLEDWKQRKTYALIGKPVMLGQGLNLQQANTAVFIGVTYKFNDLIQAVHRIQRFGQVRPCKAHVIYTEAEREVLATLKAKWVQHDEMQARMSELIRAFGLNELAMQDTLARTIGVKRIEAKGELFTVANNDAVLEAALRPDNSVDLIVTSIPFANHYEYTPSYNDFGHTQDNDHFWQQMDFLTPELVRILKPGRMACIHVKDRVLFQSVSGLGAPTMDYFHEEAAMHLRKHGLVKMAIITITTDVVRENNQTYRLGYSEMLKDGTKMGTGCSEYLLVFRKPQTDLSRGYADEPVRKSPDEYSLARWQIDAHNYWRSSPDRLLTAEELAAMGPEKLAKFFPEDSLRRLYDYERHVAVGEALGERDALPKKFMCLAPGSPDPNVWTDVLRMDTLNSEQAARNVEKHVCPLQFDIVDRAIRRYSNKGDLVYDPFHGLGTVGVRAIKLGRRAGGSELNAGYFADQVRYLKLAEQEASMPSLFDFMDAEAEAEAV